MHADTSDASGYISLVPSFVAALDACQNMIHIRWLIADIVVWQQHVARICEAYGSYSNYTAEQNLKRCTITHTFKMWWPVDWTCQIGKTTLNFAHFIRGYSCAIAGSIHPVKYHGKEYRISVPIIAYGNGYSNDSSTFAKASKIQIVESLEKSDITERKLTKSEVTNPVVTTVQVKKKSSAKPKKFGEPYTVDGFKVQPMDDKSWFCITKSGKVVHADARSISCILKDNCLRGNCTNVVCPNAITVKKSTKQELISSKQYLELINYVDIYESKAENTRRRETSVHGQSRDTQLSKANQSFAKESSKRTSAPANNLGSEETDLISGSGQQMIDQTLSHETGRKHEINVRVAPGKSGIQTQVDAILVQSFTLNLDQLGRASQVTRDNVKKWAKKHYKTGWPRDGYSSYIKFNNCVLQQGRIVVDQKITERLQYCMVQLTCIVGCVENILSNTAHTGHLNPDKLREGKRRFSKKAMKYLNTLEDGKLTLSEVIQMIGGITNATANASNFVRHNAKLLSLDLGQLNKNGELYKKSLSILDKARDLAQLPLTNHTQNFMLLNVLSSRAESLAYYTVHAGVSTAANARLTFNFSEDEDSDDTVNEDSSEDEDTQRQGRNQPPNRHVGRDREDFLFDPHDGAPPPREVQSKSYRPVDHGLLHRVKYIITSEDFAPQSQLSMMDAEKEAFHVGMQHMHNQYHRSEVQGPNEYSADSSLLRSTSTESCFFLPFTER